MGIIITNEGNQLLQDSILGNEKITFTKVEMLSDPERSPSDLSYMVDINSVEAKGEGTIVISAVAKNEGFQEGYYFNVINIYAGEVIFATSSCNIYMPPKEIKTLHVLDVYLKIDSINAELKVEYGSYVLKDEFDRLCKKVEKNEAILQNAAEAMQGRPYRGKDLTIAFEDEIAGYSDAWEWIKDRIQKNNFEGIYPADYIPVTLNGEELEIQVAGIDTFYNTTDNPIGHHIDFISRECISQSIKWNSNANNNGNEENIEPFLASNVSNVLNTTIYEQLPDEVKNVITEKYTRIEHRQSSSGTITSSNGSWWKNIGKLWLPTEYEVFGDTTLGTKKVSEGQSVQYPIFANSSFNRAKKRKGMTRCCGWWLSTPVDGNSAECVTVSSYGHKNGETANSNFYVPLCFRIVA